MLPNPSSSDTDSSLQSLYTDINTNQTHLQQLTTQLETTLTEASLEDAKLNDLRTNNANLRHTSAVTQNETTKLTSDFRLTIQRTAEHNVSVIDKLKLQHENTLNDLDTRSNSTRQRIDDHKQQLVKLDNRLTELRDVARKNQERIELLEIRKREDDAVLMKLRTTLQDMKGNVRVVTRVRPVLGGERERKVVHVSSEGNPQLLKIEEVNEQGKRVVLSTFKFDRTFCEGSTQSEVFDEIANIVEEPLYGRNGTVFAYGITGSGKTYTMQGENQTDGIFMKSCLHILDSAHKLSLTSCCSFNIKLCGFQICNDEVYDMLTNLDTQNLGISTTTSEQNKLNVYLDEKTQKVCISNVTLVPLQKENLNKIIQTIRHSSSSTSSQTHCILQIHVSGKNEKTSEKLSGTLTLVDLAGSEIKTQIITNGGSGISPSTSPKSEIKLKNSLLEPLINVFGALANQEKTVPYQCSKLTYVLQNSFSPSSKIVMIANITPLQEHLADTLNTLKFASKLNSCELSTVTTTPNGGAGIKRKRNNNTNNNNKIKE